MRIRRLSTLKRKEPKEILLARLPDVIAITDYARSRAFAVNRLIRRIFGDSYEWYGFTLGSKARPEVVADIGLPVNDCNVHQYTGVDPEHIARFQESLPADVVINGWIHSHGSLDYKTFSPVDSANHRTVLDFVSPFLKKPVARRQVVIEELLPLTEAESRSTPPGGGNVWVVTDRPVSRASIFEVVYGSFCYALLVGDGGWHRQEIHFETRGILTGTTHSGHTEAAMVRAENGRAFAKEDEDLLEQEIREKIVPGAQAFPHSMHSREREIGSLGSN